MTLTKYLGGTGFLALGKIKEKWVWGEGETTHEALVDAMLDFYR